MKVPLYCRDWSVLSSYVSTRTLLAMRLRLPELLSEHNLTAYEFAKLVEPHGISERQAYRLAAGEVRQIPLPVLEALCAVFEIADPGPLFVRGRPARGRRR